MVAGDSDRQKRKENSLTLQADCDIATIALAQAEYEERADDRKFLALTTQLEAKRLDLAVIQQLMVGCDETELAEYKLDLKKVREDIKVINNEIATWKTKDVASNEFVNNLLANAAAIMVKASRNKGSASGEEKENGEEKEIDD